MKLATLAVAALAIGLVACTKSENHDAKSAATSPARSRGEPIAYDFESLDERPVSADALRGRATILCFLATYGDASIVQARFVKKLVREHTPRINAAAIFMEPIDNRPLVRIFVDQVQIPYPSAMASQSQIQGKSPFAGVDTVPSVVVLDSDGREAFRKTGVAFPEELERALKDAEAAVWGGKR